MSELETPAGTGDIYLARGDEVNALRPIMTGDVLDGVAIPGLDDDPGPALVITHPCSMRKDGVQLIDRLLMAAVREHPAPPKDWRKGVSFRVMPLPDLYPLRASAYAALFEDVGRVASDKLLGGERVACMSVRGVNLLQQRLVNHMTRFVVPTFELQKACAPVFNEAELQEDWLDEARESGADLDEAAVHFHEFITSSDEEGRRRQGLLGDPQHLSSVRRDARRASRERYR